MFFGNTFREVPIMLLGVAVIFVVAKTLIDWFNLGIIDIENTLTRILLLGGVLLLAFSHTLEFEQGGGMKASWCWFYCKKVRPDEPISVEIKKALWSQESQTLMIKSGKRKIFYINMFDFGFDTISNAKQFISRIVEHRPDATLSDSARRLLPDND